MDLHQAWRYGVLLLAAGPLVYYALAALAAWRFFSYERQRQLADFAPPVSILKAVHGIDFATYDNYSSFCLQNYPDYEILFAVNDENDPAKPFVERLIAEHPGERIRLLIGAEYLGANIKVNKLVRMAREAKHEILVLSDGDVRVGPNYLREVVAPFADEKVGAVTSFYRAKAQNNLAAAIEAVGAASDFFAGVLMARWTEGLSFTLGASVATSKSWLAKIGGFEGFANMLADDYELGNRIAKAGGEVVLSREVVWTMYPAQTTRGFWEHQMRWARTVRLCRPVSYLGLLITQGLPWAVLAALVAPSRWLAATYLLGYVVLRTTMAWTVGVWGVQDEVLRRKFWLIPLRDALYFVVWVASFASNRVRWSGRSFTIRRGEMFPVETQSK